eukprot:c26182_g2_i1 orf=85-237(+)
MPDTSVTILDGLYWQCVRIGDGHYLEDAIRKMFHGLNLAHRQLDDSAWLS